MYFLGIILASIIAYFIGSISGSILIVRWRKNIDVRKTGSGNAGATNTLRVLGPGGGLLVVFLDALKVVLAAVITLLFSFIPNELFSQTSYFIPLLFVLIGHCGPIFFRFKGGKGVACFLGLIFVSNILYLFIFLIVWGITVAISRKVSLSSLVAAIAIGIVIWLPWLNGLNSFAGTGNSYDTGVSEAWSNPWLRFAWFNYLHVAAGKISGFQFADGMLEILLVNFLSGMLLVYRHGSNIIRLKNHSEPETFPKLTKTERTTLNKLRHSKELKEVDQEELHRLEKIECLSKQSIRIRKEIRRLRKEQLKNNPAEKPKNSKSKKLD